MKNKIFWLLIIWVIVFSWCSTKHVKTTNSWWNNINLSKQNSWNILIKKDNKMTCKQSIKDFIKWKTKIDENLIVEKWDTIIVDYIWRLDNDSIFDSSIENVSKSCWKYNPNRNYTEWLKFEVWAWQMIKWFDLWVLWMKKWEIKTITIQAKDWYWEYDKKLLIEVPNEKIPNYKDLKKWAVLVLQNWQRIIVNEIKNNSIIFDFNHELAWKTLLFDVKIRDIQKK